MMLLQANAFEIPLQDKSVHMGVSSPPYYSLRKYAGEQEFIFGGDKDCVHEFEAHERYHGAPVGKSKTRWQHTDGGSPKTHPEQYEVGPAGTKRVSISAYCAKCNAWRGAYGLEPTLQMYIDHTVEWCREVWRVLRDDATFWLNLGDSYNGSGKGGVFTDASAKQATNTGANIDSPTREASLKPKDLMGVPWRVALALQADGWYLRSDIIWFKTNPMPESVTDRPTKAHEYLFLLTKSKKYYYDQDAIREASAEPDRIWQPGKRTHGINHDRNDNDMAERLTGKKVNPAGRNKRTVWTIATAPYSGAHFATFPPALIEPCIKAGTSEKGVCPDCGNPWERVINKKFIPQPDVSAERGIRGADGNKLQPNDQWDGYPRGSTQSETLGWRPTCSDYDHLYRAEFPQARNARKRHQQDVGGYWWERVRQRPGKDHWEVLPATVLDPFSGSGTTLLVARKLGRRAIGLDIAYHDLAKERLGLKALEEWTEGKPGIDLDIEGLPLFEKPEL